MTIGHSARGAALGAVLFLAVGACGDGEVGSGSPVSVDPEPTSSPESTANGVLDAAELEDLVVGPTAPFVQRPDEVLDTGLMEPGNPESGAIGIGFAGEADLVAAGLQRGWEKFFRAPDEGLVIANVFQFESEVGPTLMFERFLQIEEPGYEHFVIEGVPESAALAGVSPEGRAALSSAFTHGRFLVVFVVGGPVDARDYRALLVTLTNDQYARLP